MTKNLVSDRMSVGVVDALELVDIDVEKGEWHIPGIACSLFQNAIEMSTI